MQFFSYITAAYATLSNSQKRKDYDNRLTHKSTAVPDKEENARSRFEEGKAEFRKKIILRHSSFSDRLYILITPQQSIIIITG